MAERTAQPLNEAIRELRTQRGWTQVELAARLNVTKQCVSNWENDNILPSVEMLTRLADLFGVSADRLLGRTLAETVDVTGLSPKQIGLLRALADELRKS